MAETREGLSEKGDSYQSLRPLLVITSNVVDIFGESSLCGESWNPSLAEDWEV